MPTSTTIVTTAAPEPQSVSLASVGKQPDIGYHPDLAKYEARTKRRLAENPDLPKTHLPEGFPAKLEGPMVWEGKDWKSEDQWVYKLSDAELKELDDALLHFKRLDKPLGFMTKDTFPLPNLGRVLHELARELYSGRGFFVLRTLPVDSYSRPDLVIMYTGLSSYIGTVRGSQSVEHDMLAHIKDMRLTHKHEHIGSTTYTSDKQVFHTDAGDLIALLSIEAAAQGGISRLASVSRIYNELAATRPDLIKTLSEPWPVDRFGQPGKPYTMRPLLWWEDGHAIIQYSRRHFTGFMEISRSPNIPPITEAQAEALDALHFLTEKLNVGLDFQKGDIEYINNMGLLHGRDGFVDNPKHARHLIRLWLRHEDLSWKIPDELQYAWDKLYNIAPEEQKFSFEPEVRKKTKTAM